MIERILEELRMRFGIEEGRDLLRPLDRSGPQSWVIRMVKNVQQPEEEKFILEITVESNPEEFKTEIYGITEINKENKEESTEEPVEEIVEETKSKKKK